jgi:multimeric flavodoxin WrbA
MKVLLINGSPKSNGNTAAGLKEMVKVFEAQEIEAEIIHVGNKDIRGCIACGKCGTLGKCVFDDIVNEVAPKFEEADGIVLGTPVYYAGPNGTLVSFVDRLFYSTQFNKAMKVGAVVTCARRGGNTATFDVMNKYFSISNMPIATSQYWNMLHGRAPGEANEDAEGMQTMRTLALNMSFLMKSIALGKEKYGMPEYEPFNPTNFIR